MKNLMGLMAIRFTKVLLIQFLHGRIFVRLAQIHILIGRIEHGRSLCAQINGIPYRSGLVRLTATVDASAGACHNFDKLHVHLTGFHGIKQLLGGGFLTPFCYDAGGSDKAKGSVKKRILRF